MMRFRSLRARLTLLFFGVTLVAVGVVFFYVTPQLETSLTEQKLRSLARTARESTPAIRDVVVDNGTQRQINQVVAQVGTDTSTRVTLLIVGGGTEGVQLPVVADSAPEVQIDGLRFDIAEDVVRTRREERGSEYRGDVLLGQVAEPIRDEGVVSRVV